MKLLVLGVGSATPQLGKHPSAFLLQCENEYILIDCGEGTQYRLLEQKLKSVKLKTICISHLHGDHYFGLAGLISSFNLAQRKEPLVLIGPPELKAILSLQIEHTQNELNFELTFVPTIPDKLNLVLEKEQFKIESFPLLHRVPTTGFLITKMGGKRRILAEKLPADFPPAFMNMLKEGHNVVDPRSGITYNNRDVTTDGEPEKRFAYCSDTACLPDIVPFISKADLLYHEATFTTELEEQARKTQHSTAAQAATIAKMAGVHKLLLGHFSARYKDYDIHLAEAQAIFEHVELAEEGASYVIK